MLPRFQPPSHQPCMHLFCWSVMLSCRQLLRIYLQRQHQWLCLHRRCLFQLWTNSINGCACTGGVCSNYGPTASMVVPAPEVSVPTMDQQHQWLCLHRRCLFQLWTNRNVLNYAHQGTHQGTLQDTHQGTDPFANHDFA